MKLNKVAIVSKFGSKISEDAAEMISKKLIAKKIKVYTIAPVSVTGSEKVESLEELSKIKLDLAVTLGGDGTTLRTFRNLRNETPILTINVGGNRGILSEITLDDFDEAVDAMIKDQVWLDKRTRVVAICNGEEFSPALNEIYVNRKNLTKTAEFEIKFQNDTVKQKMDGVIISTPSGSTGHSFSIGGPLLHESLDVLIITPVAPVHRLPSIVVPDEKIEINCSHDCNIVMDAQMIKSLEVDQKISISKINSNLTKKKLNYTNTRIEKIRVIKGTNYDYFSEEGKKNFFEKEFTVSKLSDRMGMRLEGQNIENIVDTNIRSEGLIKGVIQVTADGNPIIMLSDHGTIGGYPKIGVVISADYDKLVQISSGSKIKFQEIELSNAETLFKLYEMETQKLILQTQ